MDISETAADTSAPGVAAALKAAITMILNMVFELKKLFLAILFGLGLAAAASAEKLAEFQLRDYLGHNWGNELVVFDTVGDHSAVEVSLLGPDDAAVPFQWLGDGRQIAFLADLSADGEAVYRLVSGRRNAPTSLKVEKENGRIRLKNKAFAIDIRERLENGAGPIAGIRLSSGNWGGDSSLHAARELLEYKAEVTAAGPVYAEVLITARFSGDKLWTMRIRVIEGEPVAVIDETFMLEDASHWRLELTQGMEFNHGIFRTGWYRPKFWPTHALFVRQLTAGGRPPFALLPWINWSDGHQVSSVNLYHEDSGTTFAHDPEDRRLLRQHRANVLADIPADSRDVLFFAAGRADLWARPDKDWGPSRAVPLKIDGAQAHWHFQLSAPARRWLLGTTTLDRTMLPDKNQLPAEYYASKYCGTTLQQVREMLLVWGGTAAMEKYPRIGFPAPAGKAANQALARRKAELLLKTQQPARLFLDNVHWWDEKGGQHIRRHDYRVWTHTVCRVGFVPEADDVMGSGVLSPAEFTALRARLAFMAYKFASDDFYSPERGFNANPNMTTMRSSVVGLLGCLLSDHPEARVWYEKGAAEIRRQLDEWVGPNGGWLESPHYQSILGDGVMLFQAAYRNRLSEDIYHRNLLKTILYLAKISTPPDPRFGNLRTMPPVGNTYRFETSGFPGILAKLYRQREPVVAEGLQWMWLQHGKPMWTGIGGGSWIASIMHDLVDPDWTDVNPPDWGSEAFPYSGTVLRAHFPSTRETYMYVLHGKFNQHYDNDRGSFSLWGKGQPLCLDWGYVEPYSADMHNMLTSGQGVGVVKAFNAYPSEDYLHVDLGPWQRQVLLVKADTPEGANFVVVRDASAVPGNWHQWFLTDSPLAVDGDIVRMTGNGDVDLDVWFADGRAAEFPRMSRAEAAEALESVPTMPSFTGLQANVEESLAASTLDDPSEKTWLLKSRNESKSCPEGILGSGSNRSGVLSQRGLSLPVDREHPVMAVYYPSLKKNERPPKFTSLAAGKGVKVVSESGIDYIFMGDEPFVYDDEGIQFSGQVGAIRLRKNAGLLVLPDGGSISFNGRTLSSDGPAQKSIRK